MSLSFIEDVDGYVAITGNSQIRAIAGHGGTHLQSQDSILRQEDLKPGVHSKNLPKWREGRAEMAQWGKCLLYKFRCSAPCKSQQCGTSVTESYGVTDRQVPGAC